MGEKQQTTEKYLQHYFKSTSVRRIHSPFVYRFYLEVLKDEKKVSLLYSIELQKKFLKEWRKKKSSLLLKDKRRYEKQDFVFQSGSERLFSRLIKFFEISSFFEVGTMFIPFAPLWIKEKPDFMTQEKEEDVDEMKLNEKGQEVFSLKKIFKIKKKYVLESILDLPKGTNMIYIEEGSKEREMMSVFDRLQHQVDNDSVLIFGGIHHTLTMEKIWGRVQEAAMVTLTIDIFYYGIVFFKKEIKEKQHFKLRY